MFFAGLGTVKTDKEPHYCPTLYFAENWEDKEDYAPDVYLEVTEADIALWREMASSTRCSAVRLWPSPT